MNERIRSLRKALGITQYEFAKRIGLKQTTVSFMEKPGSYITEQNIKVICMQFNVNEEWFRTGTGPMFLENDQRKQEFLGLFEQFSPVLQDYLIQTAHALLEAQNKMQSR